MIERQYEWSDEYGVPWRWESPGNPMSKIGDDITDNLMRDIGFKVAQLIKLKTDDGNFEMKDGVPLGRIYYVKPETRRTIPAQNLDTGDFFMPELIDDSAGGALPTELLEIEE